MMKFEGLTTEQCMHDTFSLTIQLRKLILLH